MNSPQICALLTDFGYQDHYAGVMKGVILTENPKVQIVDVTHGIKPFSIIQGAFFLKQSWDWFPAPTVFVAVIDPGVGSNRKRCVYYDSKHYFIGPDNGLISFAAVSQKHQAFCREIMTDSSLFPKISNTFEGRDIFARTAALLLKGVPLEEFTYTENIEPVIGTFISPVQINAASWKAVIINIDRFGNIITNIPWNFSLSESENITVQHNSKTLSFPLVSCYSDVPHGALCAYPGSAQYLEIAVNCGNLSRLLDDINIGDSLVFQL